ncbi:hypothetical protein ARTHRO9AX_30281 [Arthrobacter sp. 9AX]|nr:hypothetical protein ARTHRO9AX_30281 [Arthrobacter sp. 9AX]
MPPTSSRLPADLCCFSTAKARDPCDSGLFRGTARLRGTPVGHLAAVVVEFISALVHGVSRKNRQSSLTVMMVADAGLTSGKPAGKFEKLLRSDP